MKLSTDSGLQMAVTAIDPQPRKVGNLKRQRKSVLVQSFKSDYLSEINRAKFQNSNRDANTLFDNQVALTKEQAAAILQVSVRTVDRLIKCNEIRIKKFGSLVRIPITEIEARLNL